MKRDHVSSARGAYEEEHRHLLRARGKLSCLFGITLVPIFSILDYVFVPALWLPFLLLRAANTAENVLIFILIHAGKNLSARTINWFMTLYFTSIGIMIAYMCRRMGGYDSTYYAGLNIVMLVVGLVMPWSALYTTVNGIVIYLAFFALGYRPDFRMADLVNSSFFLLSTDLIAAVASYWTEKFRKSEFNTRQELKELDQAKSIFFANVSHELKTPMTLVLTPMEYVLGKAAPNAKEIPLSRETFRSIRHNAYRLSELISDLLDLTKGQIGKERIRPVPVPDTETYFQEIFRSMAPLMEEKELRHEFYRSTKPPLQPHCFDRAKMEKVAVNLLSNAIKFTPKGGRIEMRIWDEERPGLAEPLLRVCVEDTGIGIPQEKIPLVFERFMQVDASSTRAYGGLGIGLSLVKDFVEQHGGNIDVESRVGVGTKMIVSLPRGKEHFRATVVESESQSDIGSGIDLPETPMTAKNPEKSNKKTRRRGKGPETVLIVDDTADMRFTLKEILQDKYRVVTAKDGIDGLKVAKAEVPHLIICDIMMPRRDGYGLIMDVRSDPALRETPVILLTAKTGAENMADGFQHGADDFIEKPFHPKEVILRVENLLRLSKRKRQPSGPVLVPSRRKGSDRPHR